MNKKTYFGGKTEKEVKAISKRGIEGNKNNADRLFHLKTEIIKVKANRNSNVDKKTPVKENFAKKDSEKAIDKRAEGPKKWGNFKKIKVDNHDDEKKAVPRASKKQVLLALPKENDAKRAIDLLLNDAFAVEYMHKNVSKNVTEIISELATPHDDEYIAAKIGIKSNAVRRALNILQGYGITNYYVSKNVNGWLSFAWYINVNKVPVFFNYIKSKKSEKVIDVDCNDYFICDDCYKTDKLIFTFDAAMENGFKCRTCNKPFIRLSKEEVEHLVEKENDERPKSIPMMEVTKEVKAKGK